MSLTSYGPRFKTLPKTLKSLLSQNYKPDRIVLWVHENDVNLIPEEVMQFAKSGIEILSIKGPDLRSGTKIIPSLISFPDDVIVTCDDDVIYYDDWLSDLIAAYKQEDEKVIICHRACICEMLDAQSFKPYLDWRGLNIKDELSSASVFPTGIGGVLYPAGCFHEDVINIDLYRKLCLTGDDIWLYFMSTMKGVMKKKIITHLDESPVDGSQEMALWKHNLVGPNDVQLQAMLKHYGREFTDKFMLS